MTREEAIRIIETVFQDEYVYKYYDSITHQALNMAIEALSAEVNLYALPKAITVRPLTEEIAIEFLQDSGWLQKHDKEIGNPPMLVRCKDCRFYWGNLGEDDTDEMYGECRWDSDEMPNADDFCSYGERKEP